MIGTLQKAGGGQVFFSMEGIMKILQTDLRIGGKGACGVCPKYLM